MTSGSIIPPQHLGTRVGACCRFFCIVAHELAVVVAVAIAGQDGEGDTLFHVSPLEFARANYDPALFIVEAPYRQERAGSHRLSIGSGCCNHDRIRGKRQDYFREPVQVSGDQAKAVTLATWHAWQSSPSLNTRQVTSRNNRWVSRLKNRSWDCHDAVIVFAVVRAPEVVAEFVDSNTVEVCIL